MIIGVQSMENTTAIKILSYNLEENITREAYWSFEETKKVYDAVNESISYSYSCSSSLAKKPHIFNQFFTFELL